MGRAFREGLTRGARNPMAWDILFGILVSVFDLELWMPVDKMINMVDDAATPAALFTIGAMVARSKMNSTSRMGASYYLAGVMIKLFIHPLLLWSIGMHGRFLGISIDTYTLTTIVLLGVLPSGRNVLLLAERFKGDRGRIGQIILMKRNVVFFTF
jgi:Predicted permeases